MAQGVPLRAYWLGVGTETAAYDGKSNQQSISDEEMTYIDNLQFSASVNYNTDKTRTSSDDTQIEIYNLNKEARNAFQRQGATILLRAGFDTDWQRGADGQIIPDYDTLPVIYVGKVTHAFSSRKPGSNDVVTRLYVSTDKIERETTKIHMSFAPKVTRKSVLKQLLDNMGMPVVRCDDGSLGDKTYPSGVAFTGRNDVALTRFCEENGLQWSVHNQAISVIHMDNSVPPEKNADGEAWLISPDQILNLEAYYEAKSAEQAPPKLTKRGKKRKTRASTSNKFVSPDKTVTKVGNTKNTTVEGVTLETYLNGSIKLLDIVKLQGINEALDDEGGALHDGLYRVITIAHDMNFLAGGWSTTVKLVELNK